MNDPEVSIRQRIKILVDELESGVQRRFAQAIGVHPTTINEILGKRQNQPSADLLQKIAQAYPQLLTDWLLLGKGQMLKPVPGEDTGINNSVVSGELLAREKPAHYETQRGAPVTHGGITVPTSRRTKGQPALEPPGTDLIRQVFDNTRDIQLMQQTLEVVIAELRQLANSREQ